MGRKNGLFILSWLLLSCLAPAFAADRAAQAGMMYGYSVPDAQNTNHFVLYGVKGSAFLSPNFSTGGYFLVSDKQGAPSEQEKFRFSVAGVHATAHIPSGSGDTYVGLRVGITKVNRNPNGIDSTFSPYHYGIGTGYDYHVTPYLALGFEGSYLHIQPGKTTQNSTVVEMQSFNIMSFMLTAQFML